jgi:hypothetical protein
MELASRKEAAGTQIMQINYMHVVISKVDKKHHVPFFGSMDWNNLS